VGFTVLQVPRRFGEKQMQPSLGAYATLEKAHRALAVMLALSSGCWNPFVFGSDNATLASLKRF
jgi:hypothetical protein